VGRDVKCEVSNCPDDLYDFGREPKCALKRNREFSHYYSSGRDVIRGADLLLQGRLLERGIPIEKNSDGLGNGVISRQGCDQKTLAIPGYGVRSRTIGGGIGAVDSRFE
jgi:hypothetical protein